MQFLILPLSLLPSFQTCVRHAISLSVRKTVRVKMRMEDGRQGANKRAAAQSDLVCTLKAMSLV